MTIPPDAGRIFIDAAAYADPDAWHEVAALLRREQPVLRVEQEGGEPFWAITRCDDVMTVERAPALFTNEEGSTLMPARPPRDEQQAVKTLINMDGDEHREQRLLINEWFKPQSIKKLTAAIEQRARESVENYRCA